MQEVAEEATAAPVSFTGSVSEFLGHLQTLGEAGQSCVLVYQDREIGAFIPLADFSFLQSMYQEEERAERPEVGWQSYSHFRRDWDASAGE